MYCVNRLVHPGCTLPVQPAMFLHASRPRRKVKNMFAQLEEINSRPEPFEFYTAADLWTEEHASEQMLAYHLNTEIDVSSRRGAFSSEELALYREAWLQPGALTAMINWYRAGLRFPPPAPPATIETPTLLIWGEEDTALGTELIEPIARPCTDIRVERIPDATHWVQHEEPDHVNALLIDFLRLR